MRFLFRLDLNLHVGARKKFEILVLQPNTGLSGERLTVCLNPGKIFAPHTSNVLTLIRSIKYSSIKKLIAQMETNSQDEFIKSNCTII